MSYFNCKVMRSKAQAHLRSFTLNVDSGRSELPVSVLLLVNWNAEENSVFFAKIKVCLRFPGCLRTWGSWCLRSEWSDCVDSWSVYCWLSVRASAVVYAQRLRQFLNSENWHCDITTMFCANFINLYSAICVTFWGKPKVYFSRFCCPQQHLMEDFLYICNR